MLRIEKVELYCYGNENLPKQRWVSLQPAVNLTHNTIKITTEEGFVGLGGCYGFSHTGFDETVFAATKTFLPLLKGKSVLNRQDFYESLKNTVCMFANIPISLIDNAMWDIWGHFTSLPVYRLLGGCREKLQAYASLPSFDSDEEYLLAAKKAVNDGYRAIKFHCYGEFEKDVQLVKAIQDRFSTSKTGLKLMLDSDLRYSRTEGFEMAKLLESFGWYWLESPISDYDYDGYSYITKNTNLPISCGGNCVSTLEEIVHGIKCDAWTDVRIDASLAGGISHVQKVMHLTSAHSKRCELQSWGPSLSIAANLHLALSNNNCSLFELAYPSDSQDFAAISPFKIDSEGYIHAPKTSGLGTMLDFNIINANLINYYSV